MPNIQDVNMRLMHEKYDIFVATETWLDEFIPNNLLFKNFSVYRNDRNRLCRGNHNVSITFISYHREI